MKNETTVPAKKWKKILKTVGCILFVPIVLIFTFALIDTLKDSNKPVITETQKTGYIEFQKSDIKEKVEGKVITTPIGSFNSKSLKSKLTEKKDFLYTDYYDLDVALDKMKNTPINKTEDLRVLNSDNQIDTDKLYEVVLHNNEVAKKGKVNAINAFYSDASNDEIYNICKLIARTVNETTDDRDIRETATILTRLKIFRHNTATDLAAITEELVFYFNPNMIDLTRDMFELQGKSDERYDDETLTFVHEIEHIKQWASNDGNEENGLELGFCRKYSDISVNSLWYQWLYEAAAEMKMSEYLDAEPRLYDKKISYVKSYELCNVFDDSNVSNSLINSTFDNDLELTYDRLGLINESEKRDFLNIMYSIQLLQYECDDFWKYYQKKTGMQLSDDEKLALKMDIRAEVIYNFTEKYYQNLIKGIDNGNIKDIETVFYMMKIWELDCCGHLSYTEKDAYSHAKNYIIWHDEINDLMFEELSKSSRKTKTEIKNEYNSYHPLIKANNKTVKNYKFYNLSIERKQFIDNCFNNYSITYFSEINQMIEYIDNGKEL